MSIGILLCGHGTRIQQGADNFLDFGAKFAEQLPDYYVESAFLELSHPTFEEGVKNLMDKKVEEIIAVPLFLFTGVHIERDIPCMLYQLGKKYDVKIRLANYIGICDEIIQLAIDLIAEKVPNEVLQEPDNTALLIAGVGASKVKANAELAYITRMVQEHFKFRYATNSFASKVTFPTINEVMNNLENTNYKNIIVLPYFFFYGVYVKRIEAVISQFVENNPNKQLYKTNLLTSNNKLFNVLLKRMEEVLQNKEDLIAKVDSELLEGYDTHHHHHHTGHHHHH